MIFPSCKQEDREWALEHFPVALQQGATLQRSRIPKAEKRHRASRRKMPNRGLAQPRWQGAPTQTVQVVRQGGATPPARLCETPVEKRIIMQLRIPLTPATIIMIISP